MDEFILNLYADYNNNPDFYLDDEIWLKLASQTNMSIQGVFDCFYSRLAFLYDAGRVNYEFGDFVANMGYQYRVSLQEGPEFAEKFWQVYLAFDDGEWHRKSDMIADPIAKYTNPQIRQFLEDNNIKG